MSNAIKIDFHLHSNFSDGMFSPEILADQLAYAGVKYAALTDHDNIDGLQRFESATKQRGLLCINGVEISANKQGRIYHLLAYGFDSEHKQLHHELERNYKHLHPGFYAKLDKFKSMLYRLAGRELSQAACLLQFEDAISLIHDAGGHVFLAHPLSLYRSDQQLNDLFTELKEYGLTGIEANYKPYSQQETHLLLESAKQNDLLVCAGSDFHGEIHPRLMDPGLTINQEHLLPFLKLVGLDNVIV